MEDGVKECMVFYTIPTYKRIVKRILLRNVKRV